LLLLVALLLVPVSAMADTMILVPGYLGSALSWRAKGITAGLTLAGWADAGHMTTGPADVIAPAFEVPGANRFYTVDIPTEAPLMLQSELIARYVALARQRHGDRIILVGHSAGGVAARLAMVRYPALDVHALITIAAPHLGSPVANLGSDIADSPLSWITPFMGLGTINRSRVLYRDVSTERPGNLVGWLNRTPHPAAQYVSIVRTENGAPGRGDSVSAGWRQDMNMVPALAGRAKTFYSLGDHYLVPADSGLIARIAAELPR
jgi:pimeloyl-ACP methyl ester carboxylesterase